MKSNALITVIAYIVLVSATANSETNSHFVDKADGTVTDSGVSCPALATRASASDSEEGFAFFAGEVVSITHMELQLKVMQKIVTFSLTETTNYLDKDENKIASTDFKAGDYVRITARMKSKTVVTLMKAE